MRGSEAREYFPEVKRIKRCGTVVPASVFAVSSAFKSQTTSRLIPNNIQGDAASSPYLFHVAGQVAADWLSGEEPAAISYGPTTSTVPPAELSTNFDPVEDGVVSSVFDAALCNLVMKQAFVRIAGSAAVYSHSFDRTRHPGAYDELVFEFGWARALIDAASFTDKETLSATYALWDGALSLFRHERVWNCLTDLVTVLPRRRQLTNASGELSAHFAAYLGDVRSAKDVPVICWPKSGIAEFSGRNWGTAMFGTSAKGRASYARAKEL